MRIFFKKVSIFDFEFRRSKSTVKPEIRAKSSKINILAEHRSRLRQTN